jgi:D-tagatose-1,6-bisphosphate aldolase subunit GatZ/KbaZ
VSDHRLAWLGVSPDDARRGVTSVCSAHPLVLEAAMRDAVEHGYVLLIEATVNQVNHLGGYTGLTPERFRDEVHEIAAAVGLPAQRLVLGGDHLGPNPWRTLPAEQALANARETVSAYVTAGFQKIHLDTSMGCAGEPPALDDATTATRAAQLAEVAERAGGEADVLPRYVIGTEVPKPGGATESLDELEVTSAAAAQESFAVHGDAFARAGVSDAFERVIALVVQPGVEFGHTDVVAYQPQRAVALAGSLRELPGVVFEAHSTDYQPDECLAALVRDGFAILKVGPALTFALREALYGLQYIAQTLRPGWGERGLIECMEEVMLSDPSHWREHYHGDADSERVLRHFSYSDRIRYYWPDARATAAVTTLLTRLDERDIPATLLSQFLSRQYARVAAGDREATGRELVIGAVRDALAPYERATAAGA